MIFFFWEFCTWVHSIYIFSAPSSPSLHSLSGHGLFCNFTVLYTRTHVNTNTQAPESISGVCLSVCFWLTS